MGADFILFCKTFWLLTVVFFSGIFIGKYFWGGNDK